MKTTAAKILAVTILLQIAGPLVVPAVQAAQEVQIVQCMTTGYYSPLPGQSFYVTGSLASDKRLNGNGTNGADGTEVYPGMIAAPKIIPFGTKIGIPGAGIGTVHDRGGAIQVLSNGEDDGIADPNDPFKNKVVRFDIWFGKGEAGLARALAWGARKQTCTIYASGSDMADSVNFKPVDAKPFAKSNNSSSHSTLKMGLEGREVKQLQESLKEAGFFEGEVTDYYGEKTYNAVVALQKQYGVIKNVHSFGAGYVGPQTRQALADALNGKAPPPAPPKAEPAAVETPKPVIEPEVIPEAKPEPKPMPADAELALEESKYIIAAGMGKNATGEDVKRLQFMMATLGYYKGKVDGVYSIETIDSILEFQKAMNIIQSDTDYGAGYFGPKTQAALAQAMAHIVEKTNQYPSESVLSFGIVEEKSKSNGVALSLSRSAIFDSGPEETELAFGSHVPQIIEPVESAMIVSSPAVSVPQAAFIEDPFFYDTIAVGEVSLEVQKMQILLKDHGFFPADTAATGYFGEITKQALTAFQAKYELSPTGEFDNATQRMFNELVMGWR